MTNIANETALDATRRILRNALRAHGDLWGMSPIDLLVDQLHISTDNAKHFLKSVESEITNCSDRVRKIMRGDIETRNCGECLFNHVEIVRLDVNGRCPRCGSEYGA